MINRFLGTKVKAQSNRANSAIKVTLTKTANGITSNNPPTITQATVPLNVTSIEELNDFVSNGATDGDVVVYDADTDKYVVEPLKLDGGEF